MRQRAFLLILTGFVGGCGSGGARPPEEPLISIDQERAKAQVPDEPPVLYRDEVDQAVDAGLGRFLQNIRVEPSLVDGGFQGFRIVEVRDPEAWEKFDLGPGDVVTSINGKPIERPEQAHEVFVSLKSADALVVRYLRGGQERALRLPIVSQ